MDREPLASTGEGYWRNWRAVLTWAIAYGARALRRILRIRLDTLQALFWQLLALRCGPAHLQSIWGSGIGMLVSRPLLTSLASLGVQPVAPP